jgi:hypothetical protein
MTLAERAAALSQAETVALLEQNAALQRQVEWFKRHLFGRKSERRFLTTDARQVPLAWLLPMRPTRRPLRPRALSLSVALPPARRRSAR